MNADMLLDIQPDIIGKTYLVVGIIFSAMLLGPFASRKFASILPKNKKKQTSTSLTEAPTIIRQAVISTAIYYVTILLMVVIIIICIFMFYLVAKDVTLGDTFTKTLETLNKYFWMNGSLLFAYSPVVLSSLVLLTVFASYVMTNQDFLTNIEFASVTNDFSVVKKKNVSKKQDLTTIEWFRKYYILLIFIATLFIYTIIFVPLWNINKVLYMKCTLLILMILIGSMATLHKWWMMFASYALIIAGYFLS